MLRKESGWHDWIKNYLPNKTIVLNPPKNSEINEIDPNIKNQQQTDGKATAYVCFNNTCTAPTTDIATMKKSLEPEI